MGVYLQIYNAGIDQTTLRPSVEVEYALIKDGKELGKQAEDWRGSRTNGDRTDFVSFDRFPQSDAWRISD